jgi:hypothetical protein
VPSFSPAIKIYTVRRHDPNALLPFFGIELL